MPLEDIDPNNGLVLKDVYLPEEVLVLILSNLDPKSLVKCRQVCKCWRDLASGPVWHDKALKEIPGLNVAFLRHHKLSWLDFYWMCLKKPFHKNFVANSCGQDKLKHWTLISGGDGWAVEQEPNGCEPFPKDFPSCFVTSYGKCSAEQQIDLRAVGLTQAVMDEVNPVITISDWYAARWDCGIEYKISVSLLNSNWEAITSFHFNDRLVDGDRTTWRNVKHEFKKYGKGVRAIQFYHSGKDTQFWAGHYGAKMTGAEVKISLPDANESASPRNTSPTEDDDSNCMNTAAPLSPASFVCSPSSSVNSSSFQSSSDSSQSRGSCSSISECASTSSDSSVYSRTSSGSTSSPNTYLSHGTNHVPSSGSSVSSNTSDSYSPRSSLSSDSSSASSFSSSSPESPRSPLSGSSPLSALINTPRSQ